MARWISSLGGEERKLSFEEADEGFRDDFWLNGW